MGRSGNPSIGGRTRTARQARPIRVGASRFRGLTLLEALTATIVLAGATLAICVAINVASAQSDYALHAQRGSELANELMERIAALPYYDPGGVQTPGPEAGETGPALYDNADDYHGYVELPKHISNRAGTLYPAEYQVFTRSVTAQYGNQTVAGLGTLVGLNVTVTVKDGAGDTWTVTRFIPQPAP